MNDQLLQEMLDKAAQKALIEYSNAHHCKLSEVEISDLRTVSAFLTKFRNAIGNVVMAFILALVVIVVGLIAWAVSLGKINPFKFIGL